jgi:hypothetical protein
MNASFMTCQDIQIVLFNHLDSDDEPEPPLDEQVMEHLAGCKACQQYQSELSVLIDGLKNSDVELPVMPSTDKLADRVWERLLAETDLGSLSDAEESTPIRFLTKPPRAKAWWAQPVAPMAAAAVLVVMAGFSYQSGNFSNLLSFQTAYVSPDYELDGQKLVYDSADQILDPTWIDDSTSVDQTHNAIFPPKLNHAVLSEQNQSASALLLDSNNNDPLQAWVGF